VAGAAGVRRPPRLAALALAALCAACATRVGVEVDPRADPSRWRRWAWLPRAWSPLRGAGEDGAQIERLVSARIERELAARGYLPAEGGAPDIFVTWHAELARELVAVTETPAVTQLSSLHQSPSYIVSAPVETWRLYESAVLAIDVADGAQRQLVWRGTLEKRVRGRFARHAQAAVARILAELPPAREP
jgi:hypothetical protein